MLRTRVIPCLLIDGRRLVKTLRFRNPRYLGDPLNAVRIFNEKEVDELIILDISATEERRAPDFDLVADIAGEAFMPVSYGGGIAGVGQAERLFSLGVEKVVLNSAALERPELISEIARVSGRQSVVVCVDVGRSFLGRYLVMSHRGRRRSGRTPVDWALAAQAAGAGEILVQSIDRDGTMSGYDIELLRTVSERIRVPVVAMGGCSGLADMRRAVVEGGSSAVAAGSLFVFHGPRRAVLITFPDRAELTAALGG